MSGKYITENRKTPVNYECDVLVAGGGTAGVVAALAAARNGAKTILIERNGFLGGTLVSGAGPIHSFFNLYKAFPGAEEKQVIKGIPEDIINRLVECGGSLGHLEQDKGGNYDSRITLIDWEIFKDVIFQMLEEAGVQILLHVMAVDVVKEQNTVKGVIIEGKSGREAILARTVIDATGDGDIAYFAGAEFVKRHETTSAGFPFGMSNVDMPRLVRFLEENGLITQLIRGNKGSDTDDVIRLGFELKRIPAFKDFMEANGMWGPLGFSYHENNYTYINSCNLRAVDATDTVELSKAEIQLRRQAMKLARMLIEHIPGFERAYVSWTPPSVGIRLSRIIKCEYEMTLDDIVNCARFDDEVLLYGFHDCAPKIVIKDAGYYGIPYRAFIPKGLNGILVAGRLITSTWEAHMSTRNTGCCMAQGQAVGTAAAIAAKDGVDVRDVDIQNLRTTLKEQNVYLE